MLNAHDITFDYGDTPVLAEATLAVHAGELLGLVGPNGAGKSTLLRCLYGALRPRTGSVRLRDRLLSTLSRQEIARAIGVVPQRCDVAFPVSVRHFVELGRFAREQQVGGTARAHRTVVDACLAELELTAFAGRSVDELSGGEFRRVLIAQALAQEPSILLFDEPLQQLDLLHQLEVMEFARAFSRRGGSCAVIVLHDLGLAARFCDRIALLHGGRIVASGAPEAVLTQDVLERVWGVRVALERSRATGAIHVVPVARARSSPVESERQS